MEFYFMMKRPFKIAALSAFLVMALVSCNRQQSVSGGEAPSEFSGTEQAVPAGNVNGVVLIRAGLWELQNENQVKWVRYINAGETVEWKDESRKLVNPSANNAENEYFRVYAGGDYWIRDYAVEGPANPGIITGFETVLYSQPDLGSPLTSGTNTIHQYTIVAVHPEQQSGFLKISAYYANSGKYIWIRERYVKAENVSTDVNDVKGISLYQLAMATEDSVVKKELLNNALSLSDRYYDLIQRALIEAEYADGIETIAATDFAVVEDELYVYDRPDEDNGEWVDSVGYGDTVTAIARTKEQTSFYGSGAYYWYKIAEPEGWVFGAYLESPDTDAAE
ncbi:MAG: SH3 domain-containing protein [Treponema sp.]|jgi:hypothetical protein|nr:SH3 domain-containing protein [Treponema sp.]